MTDIPLDALVWRHRTVRVFVSSTFRDLFKEREVLIKHVFPQLRKLCERRGVAWGEIDLRWGVTEEHAQRGDVLGICLAEIDRCPLFLGILGQRYGWVPSSFPAGLLEREPWLADCQGCSATELEIIHGVFRRPQGRERAVFYFRPPVADQPGRGEADPRQRARLERLKDRIREHGLLVREGQAGPQAFGRQVLEDLTRLVDRLFPEGTPPSPLDREALDHETFAESRTWLYVSRPAYFDCLDAHATGSGPPVVVTGAAGAGKSALLASWARSYQSAHPSELVLTHFIGATSRSTDWAALLGRLLAECQRRRGVPEAVPESAKELLQAFADCLGRFGRIVLVLDALDKLEDRDGALELAWLPARLPAGVRLVCSTLPARPLDELKRRGWSLLQVEPWEFGERERFITSYLRHHGKALAPERVRRLAAGQGAGLPLYLRALLEELRVYGEHETLDERIGYYLQAPDVRGLYQRILARYEQDYERDRPGLVRDAFTLLWSARRGLSEAELLDLLGRDCRPLAQALWSPLRLAAEASLLESSGLITFSHDSFRQAVQTSYLLDKQERQAAHLRVADYFEGGELGLRAVDELPWQLALTHSWPRLRALLANPAFFERAWREREYDVLWCWRELEANSPFRLVDAVARLGAERAQPGVRFGAAELLMKHGEHRVARDLFVELEALFQDSGDLANAQASVGNQAICLAEMGELVAALDKFEEQGRLARQANHRAGMINSLQGRAATLTRLGRPEQAGLPMEELVALRRDSNPESSSGELGVIGAALLERGEFAAALHKFEEQERIALQAGREDEVLGCWGNMAHALLAAGQPAEAEAVAEKLYLAARKRSDARALLRALDVRAELALKRGNGAGAYRSYKEQEPLCRQLQDQTQLAISLSAQAVYLAHELGLYDQAMRKANEACELTQSLPAQQQQPFIEAREQVRRLLLP